MPKAKPKKKKRIKVSKSITKKIVFAKTKDFLSQIPNWEKEYKSSDKLIINFEKASWKNAKAHFSKCKLEILGEPVMEDWETPYMKKLADIATSRGGTILELGYGMGISSNFIQKHKIDKHIIIEANRQVAKKAKEFAKKSPHKVEVLNNFWEKIINKIPHNSVAGILFDTYPLTDAELYQNHFNFFPYAYKLLIKGGIFTYYSDEIKKIGKVHLKKLQEAGFKKGNIKYKVVKVSPPKKCEYWKANTIVAPIVTK